MKRQICNYVGAGLMALSFMNFISCTEIEHGVNDIDTWDMDDLLKFEKKIEQNKN